MALSTGDTVLPVAPSADVYVHGARYPLFGIVVEAGAGATDAIISWRDGSSTGDIADNTTLDVLGAPASPVVPVGAYVRVTPEDNPNQQLEGRVVAAFTRDNDGAGSPGPTKLVIRNRDGLYTEVLESDAEVVPSR